MKKVLIIANEFLPQWSGGVLRVFYFVKYLPRYGYNPHVLTMKKNYFNPALGYDEQKIKELGENTKIYRVDRSFWPGVGGREEIKSVARGQNFSFGAREKIKYWLKRLLLVPDSEIRWHKEALAKGREIIKNNDIQLIFTTSPPVSTHIIGLKLKQETGLPWVFAIPQPRL